MGYEQYVTACKYRIDRCRRQGVMFGNCTHSQIIGDDNPVKAHLTAEQSADNRFG
ncbi:hypothetical protein D3C81_2280770 [compost metagenome]